MHPSITKLGGRRFLMVLGAGMVYTVLLILKYLTGSEYVTLQLATVAAYLAANTYQKTKGVPDAG